MRPTVDCVFADSTLSTCRFTLQRRNKRAHRLLHERIVPERVDGLKRATAVSVGEKHSLALQVCSGVDAYMPCDRDGE